MTAPSLSRFLCHTGLALLGLAALLLPTQTARAQQETAPPPASPQIELTPENTLSLVADGRRLARIERPAISAPVLGAQKNRPAHQLLRRLAAMGKAAGNAGDLYDNRDRDHSPLSGEAHPQLTHIRYGEVFRKKGADYGLAGPFLFDAPVIGNSSTALTGKILWRSQPRAAMTLGGAEGPYRLFQNYASGQIHIYPEHRDHDAEHGDQIPANTPYLLISQGSSGSDLPHLEALAMILAAFRPDTKAALVQAGLIAPTVQMVYRRARKGIRSPAAYRSGAAHPSVFHPRDILLAQMVGVANAILPENIPPMVRLNVLEETRAREGIDYFGEGLSEVLFDTPSAIARIWRSRTGRRSMLVSAAETRDPNGRALTFHWSVLRGDPAHVTITPITPDGSRARIEMDWHPPGLVPSSEPGVPDLATSRIDIGVFANNGAHDSAPAFISVLMPGFEARDYAPGPDGAPRVMRINRQVPPGAYADPALFPDTDWQDSYHYDATGTLTGWTRERGDKKTLFNAKGQRLSDADGPALPVRYTIARASQQRPRLIEESAGVVPTR